MKTQKTILQDLNLEIGEKASCTAGYPKKGTVIVECIKSFDSAKDQANDIINNPYDYLQIIDAGKFGLLTSHLISSNWFKLMI